MARGRMLYLPAVLLAAVLVACAAALLALSEKAEATFPGKYGKIAYERYDGNDYEIYTIDPDGGGELQLTNNIRDDHNPAYSPDGKRIAYSCSDGGLGDLEICTINVRGGNRVQLTHNSKIEDWLPDYSPDGKKIAYSRGSFRRNGEDLEINTINVRGGNRGQLTHNGKGDYSPSYSPDGKRIAYWAEDGHDGEIYTVAAEGGRELRATNNATNDGQPSYSPNGNKLAYTCTVGTTGFTRFICTRPADGRGRSQVTDHGPDEEDMNPSWGIRP